MIIGLHYNFFIIYNKQFYNFFKFYIFKNTNLLIFYHKFYIFAKKLRYNIIAKTFIYKKTSKY